MIHKLFISLFLLFSVQLWALNSNDIVSIPIDKPIWAFGLNDASWLFPNIKRNSKVAIFDFSIKQMNMPKVETQQREDDIGRTSRSIPLYIFERLFIESDIEPVNYVFCVKNIGPIVSAKRTSGIELNDQLKNRYDYIITGTVEKNYLNLQTVIKIYVFETKNKIEKLIVEYKTLGKSTPEAGAIASDLLIVKFIKLAKCKTIDLVNIYQRPQNNVVPYYLDGLGQLLMQTLIQNKIVSKEGLWGEKDILQLYKTLWDNDNNNNCIKIMYIKGIIASIDYKGDAYISHIDGLKRYIFENINSSDYIVKLSPILFKKINDTSSYKKVTNILNKNESGEYLNWINNL